MIEIRGICAGYDGRTVLHGVSMDIAPGSITAIVGPNGCGKSTLLKTIVRIHPQTSGAVRIDGQDSASLSSRMLARRIAYLPQSRRAPEMPVLSMVLHGRFAHLSYPRRYRPQDMEKAWEALRWAGLEDAAQENVSRLSGGMRQKAYIAMALCQDADTILMDEPTTYLDVAHQLRLMDMVRELADGGKAVVMVLHDLSLALRTADRIVVMRDGRVTADGTPESVYAGGVLDDTFGVHVVRVMGESGAHYVCETKNTAK